MGHRSIQPRLLWVRVRDSPTETTGRSASSEGTRPANIGRMTRVIGLRAEPRQFNWAVVEGTQQQAVLVAHDTATAPVSLGEAAALSWVRQRAQLIIDTKSPTIAVLRAPEFVRHGGNT